MADERRFFGLPGVNEETVKFSLLGTALDYEGIQDFVYKNPDQPFDEREVNEDHLKELFSWMFEKDRSGATKLGESRRLKELSKVVASEEGLRQFRRGVSLDGSYRASGGVDVEFDSLTTDILNKLREANSYAADVRKEDFREEIVASIHRQSSRLRSTFE